MSAHRLLGWLALFALLLAPFAMIGGAPAMAHDRPPAAGHCAETGMPAKAPAPVDCMVACAGCLPSQDLAAAPASPPVAAAEPARPAFRLRGISPEAATPPPRFS